MTCPGIFNPYINSLKQANLDLRDNVPTTNWWTIPKGEEISMDAFRISKHDIRAPGGLEEATLNLSKILISLIGRYNFWNAEGIAEVDDTRKRLAGLRNLP